MRKPVLTFILFLIVLEPVAQAQVYKGRQFVETYNGLNATTLTGILLQNKTAATSGEPVQTSPSTTWTGTSWNGTASVTSSISMYNAPKNAATPYSRLQVDAGATNILTVSHRSGETDISAGSAASSISLVANASRWIWIDGSSDEIDLTTAAGSVIWLGTELKPGNDVTKDLGDASYRWRTAYIRTVQMGDTIGNEPVCGASTEGSMYYVKANSGVADGYSQMCMANSAGVYAWKTFVAP